MKKDSDGIIREEKCNLWFVKVLCDVFYNTTILCVLFTYTILCLLCPALLLP